MGHIPNSVAFIAYFFMAYVLSINPIWANYIGPKKELFKVDEIVFEGHKKVEIEAIKEKISVKVNEVVTNNQLRNDITKLYSMQYFDHVQILHTYDAKTQKNILTYKVKERPIIKEIKFTGRSAISLDDLKAKIKTKEYSILNESTIKSDIAAMEKLYEEKGFFLATINYELQVGKDEAIRLKFNIKEFEKIKVKKITFLGNKAFQDNDIKSIMQTREEGLLSAMTDSGNFKDLDFETDVQRINYFYRTKGYLQINVGKPTVTVSEDKRWIFITISVNEGPKFYVNQIFFKGDLLFTEQELNDKISMVSDDVYSEEVIRNDIQSLTETYQDLGYAFTNVIRDLEIVPGENKVDVTYNFEKGKMAYFGNISVKGNSKTRDKVVRRELRIVEGQKYSGSKLRESKENVRRLGFFEDKTIVFNTVANKERDNILDVEITIEEKNTGQIQLGAGYSSGAGAFLQGSISQSNFRGLGQILSISMNLAHRSKDIRLSLLEPYLFDTYWTLGGDIFRSSDTQSLAYDAISQGLNIRAGHPIDSERYTQLMVVYKFIENKVSNVQDPTISARTENGITSSIEPMIIHDKRNNRMEPSGGHYVQLSSEFAGIGGQQHWSKVELDTRYFKRLFGDLVFRSKFFTGKLFKTSIFGESREIPRTRHYFLGGSRTLRGFGFSDVGPRSQGVDFANNIRSFPLGGLHSVYTNIELEHPLIREAGLKWVLFFDSGNVFENVAGGSRINDRFTLRSDYGFGIRWFSPIGPLRFEFGYPIAPRAHERGHIFHFDIGQFF